MFLKRNSGLSTAGDARLNVANHKYVTFSDCDDAIAVEGGGHKSNVDPPPLTGPV